MFLTNQNAEIVACIRLKRNVRPAKTPTLLLKTTLQHKVKPGNSWLHKVKIIVFFTLDTVDCKMVVAK